MTDNDNELFHKQLKGVTPLKSRNKVTPSKKPPQTKLTVQPQFDTTSSLLYRDSTIPSPVGADEPISFHQTGVQVKTLRQLKQGKLPIESELDLHGFTLEQADQALQRFIGNAYQMNWRVVRVVHGKGRSSGNNEPPVKNAVNRWLREHSYVLAFSSVPPPLGGTGVVHVLIKRNSEAD